VEAVFVEWLSLVVRWLHVVAAIAWIGSSFHFIHLDLSLKRRQWLPEGVQGDAWQVHGGGFYHMVKFLVTPTRIPDELTVHSDALPPGNITGMTGDERLILAAWLAASAPAK
jgi:uncharacterized membrane protein